MTTVDMLAIGAAIAGVLMAIAPTLQVRRMRRMRSSNDVSVLYLSMLDAGFVLWLAYGLALGNFAMIISNTASLTFMTVTISVALWYRRVGGRSGPRSAAGDLEASAPEG
jgi:MtN3 and saliva related transmembrane protein